MLILTLKHHLPVFILTIFQLSPRSDLNRFYQLFWVFPWNQLYYEKGVKSSVNWDINWYEILYSKLSTTFFSQYWYWYAYLTCRVSQVSLHSLFITWKCKSSLCVIVSYLLLSLAEYTKKCFFLVLFANNFAINQGYRPTVIISNVAWNVGEQEYFRVLL